MSEKDLGTLYARIAIENSFLRNDVNKIKAQFKELADTADSEARRVNEAMQLKGVTSQIGSNLTKFVTLPILAAGAAGLKFASSIEATQQGFGVLLGDMEKGKALYAEMIQLSAKTPLQLPDVTKTALALLNAGTAVSDLKSRIMMLGDVSMGNAEKLDSVTRAFARMQTMGKVNLETLNIMIEAQVPIIGALEKQYGVTGSVIYDMVAKSKIGFEDVKNALQAMTSEGGKYYKYMEIIGQQTAEGKLSTAIDNLRLSLANMMTDMVPVFKSVLDSVSGIAGAFSSLNSSARSAILGMLGMAAVVGPTMKAVEAFTKLKEVFLLIGKSAWGRAITIGVAALAAIGGIITAIRSANSLAADGYEQRLSAAEDTSAEVEKLTARYKALSAQTKLSFEESRELVTIAARLKELFPELTGAYDANTKSMKLNNDELDRANTLARGREEVARLAALAVAQRPYVDATNKLANDTQLRDFAASSMKDAENQLRQIGVLKKTANVQIGDIESLTGRGLDSFTAQRVSALKDSWISSAKGLDLANKQLAKSMADYKAAEAKWLQDSGSDSFAGKPSAAVAPKEAPAPASGGSTAKTQGQLLKELDDLYTTQIASIRKGSAEREAVEQEYQKKRMDMLNKFHEQDVASGYTAIASLESHFKGYEKVYGSMSAEMDATKKIFVDKNAAIMEPLNRLADAKKVSVSDLIADPNKTQEVADAIATALDGITQRYDALLAAGGDPEKMRAALDSLRSLGSELSNALKIPESPWQNLVDVQVNLRTELSNTINLVETFKGLMAGAFAEGDQNSVQIYSAIITQLEAEVERLRQQLGIAKQAAAQPDGTAFNSAISSGDIKQASNALKSYNAELIKARDAAGTGTAEYAKWQAEIDKAQGSMRQLVETKITNGLTIANTLADAIKQGVTDGWESVDWTKLGSDLALSIGSNFGTEGQLVGGIISAVLQLSSTVGAIISEPSKQATEEAKKSYDELQAHIATISKGIAESLSKAVSRGDTPQSILDNLLSGANENKIADFTSKLGDMVAVTTTVHHDGEWVNPLTHGGTIYQLPYDETVRTTFNQLITAYQNASGEARVAIGQQLLTAIQGAMNDAGIESTYRFSSAIQGLDSDLAQAAKTGDFTTFKANLRAKIIDAVISEMIQAEYMAPAQAIIDALYKDGKKPTQSEIDAAVASIADIATQAKTKTETILGSLGSDSSPATAMISALSDSLAEAAFNGDYTAFRNALGEQIKKNILSEVTKGAAYQAIVKKIVDQYFALKNDADGFTAADAITLAASVTAGYTAAGNLVKGDLANLQAAGLADQSITVKNQGTMITQLTGGDRDYFTDLFKNFAAAIQPIVTINQAALMTISAQQVIVNTISIYNEGGINVYASDGTSLTALIEQLVAQAMS